MALTLAIRSFRPADALALANLFSETIRAINLGDYTQEQVAVWAAGEVEVRAERWASLFLERTTFVAEADRREIVGFADAERDGHLDHLFVHRLYQRRGVATALHAAVESDARRSGLRRLFTEASLTARAFFLRMGYLQLRPQVATVRGVGLTNFVMEKQLGIP